MALCRFCATTYTLASSVRRTISGSASVSIFRLASGSAAPKSFATSRPQRAGRSLHSSACNFREQPQSTSSFPPASANDATAPPPRPVAFAFDIDGVLKSGPVVLPAAKRALKLLDGGNHLGVRVPTIYITNGGGYAEERRAELLSEELGVEISPSQIVQSHTVMKSLVSQYGRKPILMIGGPEDPPGASREIMQRYGFEDVYTAHDLQAWAPSAWPFSTLPNAQLAVCRKADFSKIRFAAVLVFHDSRDWGRDIQLITDVLRARDGVFGTLADEVQGSEGKQQLPLYFSHGDLLWGTNFPVSRFGQGAFRLALDNVYHKTTGRELEATTFGKPHKLTYDYAHALLENLLTQSASTNHEVLEGARPRTSVWMVGDNPESDIAGANAYGWSSALVRTGVYRDVTGPPRHAPTILVDDVEQAVRVALEKEWGPGSL